MKKEVHKNYQLFRMLLFNPADRSKLSVKLCILYLKLIHKNSS